jgi:hypothetical protein
MFDRAIENAKLRHALAAETRVLKSIREIVVDGLRPGVTAEQTLERLWDEAGSAFDPAQEIEEAEALLHPE